MLEILAKVVFNLIIGIRLIKSHIMQLSLFGVHVLERQYGTVKNTISNID